jgi:DNA-binding transcriptional regulator YhcF (GntR family)
MRKKLQIKANSAIPKYQQIVDDVIEKIQHGILRKGDQLSTINEVRNANGLARMTIIKAYEELRAMGVVEAHHGKGYFITKDEVKIALNIFVLFDAMNDYKETLFNAMRESLGELASMNMFFHYHDVKVFENLIVSNIGNYNRYIIMPHFNEDVSEIVKQIPKEKLLILDHDVEQLDDDYCALYQDFEKNIYQGLTSVLQKIKKYESFTLFLSKKHFQYTPTGIIAGFNKFCLENNIKHAIMDNLDENLLKENHAYLLFLESDLVRIVNWADKKRLQFGQNIGLISYDDTPIKALLAHTGITTISNDFKEMGKAVAPLIFSRRKGKTISPCSLIDRGSL